jgi:hypothetical protein
MKIPEDKQYENLTTHLRYLNEKIIQSFNLFVKLATAIVGGVFFLNWKLVPGCLQRAKLHNAASGLFVLVSLSMIFLILRNLLAWRGYRKELSRQYPDIVLTKGCHWWISEAVMCFLIAVSCIGFLVFNPL